MPKASIIIPVLNNLELTGRCIKSIQDNTRDYELVVVDNASDDDMQGYLEVLAALNDNVHVIRNPLNLGWPLACNQGLARATGDYVVLLNNDTEVCPGWLDRLLAPFADPTVGLVGPMSDNVSGPQSVGHRADWHKAAERLATVKAGQYRFTSRLVGFCLAIRREVVSQLGGLDPRFGLGNFDDDDYCLRAQLAGWKLAIAEDCFVHHAGHATFDAERIDLTQTLGLNRRKFLHKWRSLGLQGATLEEMAQGTVDAKDLFIALPDRTPTISLCMIVRDEEQYLEDCLKSVAGAVDEIVIVDTGSTDGTLAIARRYGAKIREIAWQYDFAGARNTALEMATGDWVLVLDADERLKPESVPELRWLSYNPVEFGVICQIESQAERKKLVSPVVRFFRNHLGVRYEGRLHEQPNIPRRETALDMSGIRITHLGYDPSVIADRSKLERNLHIAQAQYAEAETFHAVFNLTRAHWELGDYREAAGFAARAKSMTDYPADVLHASVMEIAAVASWDHEQALDLACALRDRYPAIPRTGFMVAKILEGLGRFGEAMVAADWRTNPEIAKYLSSDFTPADLSRPGTGLVEAAQIYTRCAIRLGRASDAIRFVVDAINVVPAPSPDLYEQVARLLLAAGCHQLAGEWLNKALKLDPGNPERWTLMATICERMGRADLAADARGNVAKLAA